MGTKRWGEASKQEADFRRLAHRLYYPGQDVTDHDDQAREIVITPYGGAYGAVAGYVVAVNGSPPKGTFIVLAGYAGAPIYFVGRGKGRTYESPVGRAGKRNAWVIIMDFLESIGIPPSEDVPVPMNMSPVVIEGCERESR